MGYVTVSIDELKEMGAQILTKEGVPAQDAATVVASLLDADIRGQASHGLMRLKPYTEHIRAGLIAARPQIRDEAVSENMFKVDGGNGLGQVVGMHTVELCMESAARLGNAVAVVNHMNHYGAAGFFTRYAAARGFMAFSTTSASATMAPFGGLDNLLGTNPFSVSFGAGKYDNFTLDVATTAVARGKIRLYEKEGKPIPQGWAIDENGNDTTDPAAALRGSLLPMGMHKGYGLSMLVDVLSGLLPGANLSCDAESMFETEKPANTGCFFAVIDISRFVPRSQFESEAEAWFDRLKAARLRPGFREIFIPGEIENRKAAAQGETLELLDKTYSELRALLKG